MARNTKPLDGSQSTEFVKELYQKYKRLILWVAKKYTPILQDQEDIAQNTIEKLIGRIPLLRSMEHNSLVRYIIYTTRSVAVDLCRSQARIREHFISMEEGEIEQLKSALAIMSLEDEFIYNEQLMLLKDIWVDLPEEDQLLLEGKYVWELTDKELSADFNCKPDSIRMKLTRARRNALQQLTAKEGM